jgi:hypothetical protein
MIVVVGRLSVQQNMYYKLVSHYKFIAAGAKIGPSKLIFIKAEH